MKNRSCPVRALLAAAALVLAASVPGHAVLGPDARGDHRMIASPPPPGGYMGDDALPDPVAVRALESAPQWRGFKATAGEQWSARWNTHTGAPHIATGPAVALPGYHRLTSDNIKSACLDFIAANAGLLRAKTSDLEMSDAAQAGGRWYVDFRQVHQGVPVLGGRVTMSFTRNDRLIAFGSDVFPDVDVETLPAIDAKAAVTTAASDCKSGGPPTRIDGPELCILPVRQVRGFHYVLCWQLDVFQREAHRKWQYLVDAASGRIVGKWDTLKRANVTGLVRGEYIPEFPGDSALIDIVKRARVYAEGPEVVIKSWDMDTDPVWTLEGQWAFGHPTGGGSHNKDPNSGHTGENVIGYNLSGDYSDNMLQTYYATTPPINCTGLDRVRLRFWRWLGVESSWFDSASIQVSTNGVTWTEVWRNGEESIADTSWGFVDYDISSIADNQPTIYVRWSMGPTDSSVTYPGWNIDDVKVVQVLGGINQTYAADDGTYSVTAPWDPCVIISQLKGVYCDIRNAGGIDARFSREPVYPGDTVDWTWDPSCYGFVDEPSVYRHVNHIHDFYKTLDPAFAGLDYAVPVDVHIPDYDNAYWDGTGMAFGAGDGVYYGSFGLASEVVYHEYTHGVTDKIYAGTSFPYADEPGAMNEGWSDYFGCILSLSQSPKVGDGGLIIGQPDGFRTLQNDYRREADWHAEVHDDSQMFSGALWEARAALGNDLMSELVHFARYIRATTFEDYVIALLVEDDTRYGDSNITNGTPHAKAIYDGFGRHGIGGLRYKLGSAVIDDSSGNGNGKLDPGETAALSIRLVNGWSNATDIQAVLTTADPYITLTKAEAAFPDANHLDEVDNSSDRFLLSVSPSCPETHTVNLSLHITASGPYAYTRDSLFYQRIAVDQIAYDDGGADLYTGVWAGDGLAARITPEAYPCPLTHVRLFPYDARTVTIKIWDDDGPGEMPGTVLASLPLQTPAANDWFDVDISSLGVLVESGSVYIGWIGESSDYDTLYFNGYDLDPPDAQRMYLLSGYDGQWYGMSGNLMIRARVGLGMSVAAMKREEAGTRVGCSSAIVTASFPDFFYIEDVDRSCGIRVEKVGHGIGAGSKAAVTGTVHVNADGEACIAAEMAVSSGTGTVEPILVTGRDLGGGRFGLQGPISGWKWGMAPYVPPTESVGVNNIGLLMRITGLVTAWGRGWFYVEDGSAVSDGTPYPGVYVGAHDLICPRPGAYVAVTGISSCEYFNSNLVNVFLARTQDDIAVISQLSVGSLQLSEPRIDD